MVPIWDNVGLYHVGDINEMVPRVGHDPTRTIERPTAFETALYANSKHLGKVVSQRGHDPLIPYGPTFLRG